MAGPATAEKAYAHQIEEAKAKASKTDPVFFDNKRSIKIDGQMLFCPSIFFRGFGALTKNCDFFQGSLPVFWNISVMSHFSSPDSSG